MDGEGIDHGHSTKADIETDVADPLKTEVAALQLRPGRPRQDGRAHRQVSAPPG